MENTPETDNIVFITEMLIRLTALEKVLVQKNILTVDELAKEMESLSKQLTETMSEQLRKMQPATTE
jgi:hypothetical protein